MPDFDPPVFSDTHPPDRPLPNHATNHAPTRTAPLPRNPTTPAPAYHTPQSTQHAGPPTEQPANPTIEPTAGTEVPLWLALALAFPLTAATFGLVYLIPNCYVRRLFLDYDDLTIAIPPVTVLLAWWAGSTLFLKARKIASQGADFREAVFPRHFNDPIGGNNIHAVCAYVGRQLQHRRQSMLLRRVWHALDHFRTSKSRSEVADYLGSQAQLDTAAAASSYTMLKFFIWAIPILGFIGTVLGISTAVGGFSDVLAGSEDLGAIKNTLSNVTVGLAVAFNTTLLALILSVFIMFPASIIQRREDRLLARIEDFCNEHVVRRLKEDADAGQAPPGQAQTKDVAEDVRLAIIEGLQTSVPMMGETIEKAFTHEVVPTLRQMFTQAAEALRTSLAPAEQLGGRVSALADEMGRARQVIQDAAERNAAAVDAMQLAAQTISRSGADATGSLDQLVRELSARLDGFKQGLEGQRASINDITAAMRDFADSIRKTAMSNKARSKINDFMSIARNLESLMDQDTDTDNNEQQDNRSAT